MNDTHPMPGFSHDAEEWHELPTLFRLPLEAAEAVRRQRHWIVAGAILLGLLLVF